MDNMPNWARVMTTATKRALETRNETDAPLRLDTPLPYQTTIPAEELERAVLAAIAERRASSGERPDAGTR